MQGEAGGGRGSRGCREKTPNVWHTAGMVPSFHSLASSADLLSHQHPQCSNTYTDTPGLSNTGLSENLT